MPSHVFVHHEDTQASAPAEMTEGGTEVVKKSSSPVHRNDTHPIHRSHTQQQCVWWLQHASVLNTSASLEEGRYETAKLLRKYSQLHNRYFGSKKSLS